MSIRGLQFLGQEIHNQVRSGDYWTFLNQFSVRGTPAWRLPRSPRVLINIATE